MLHIHLPWTLYSLHTDVVNKPQKQTQHSKYFGLPHDLRNITQYVQLSEEIPHFSRLNIHGLTFDPVFSFLFYQSVRHLYHFCTNVSHFTPYAVTVLERMRSSITQDGVLSNQ